MLIRSVVCNLHFLTQEVPELRRRTSSTYTRISLCLPTVKTPPVTAKPPSHRTLHTQKPSRNYLTPSPSDDLLTPPSPATSPQETAHLVSPTRYVPYPSPRQAKPHYTTLHYTCTPHTRAPSHAKLANPHRCPRSATPREIPKQHQSTRQHGAIAPLFH